MRDISVDIRNNVCVRAIIENFIFLHVDILGVLVHIIVSGIEIVIRKNLSNVILNVLDKGCIVEGLFCMASVVDNMTGV